MYAPIESARSFVPGSVQWYTDRRVLKIRRRTIELTRTEYRLLYPLREGQPVTYEDLASSVYGCLVDPKVRVMMDKHIDRIRGKLRGSGVYVYCVLGYGYILLSELDMEEERY